MNRDYLPSKDGPLLNWMNQFSSEITSTPTAFGLVAGQATAMAALVATFATKYAASIDPATRTKQAVQEKNDAKKPMKVMARNLAKVIQAYPSLTNGQRVLLGLTVRDTPSPINPPTTAPVLEIVKTNGRLISIALREVGSERRGKPAGVSGATVFSYVGATPPADINAWKYEGEPTRTSFDVEFAPTVAAGAQVWLTCFWKNFRDQAGPACMPVSAYIAGGVVAATA